MAWVLLLGGPVAGAVVFEVLPESEVPIEKRYHPDFLAQCIETAQPGVAQRWVYDGTIFTPPPPIDPAG